jgi:hypothetical protein
MRWRLRLQSLVVCISTRVVEGGWWRGKEGDDEPDSLSFAADVADGSNALRPKNSSLEMPFCVPNFCLAYFSPSSCAGLPTLPKPPIFFCAAAAGFLPAPTWPNPRRATPMPSRSVSGSERSVLAVEPKPPRGGDTGVGDAMEVSGTFDFADAAAASAASASGS